MAYDQMTADLLRENEELREILRTVAVSIPAVWKDARGHQARAYEVMSEFLIEDQRHAAQREPESIAEEVARRG